MPKDSPAPPLQSIQIPLLSRLYPYELTPLRGLHRFLNHENSQFLLLRSVSHQFGNNVSLKGLFASACQHHLFQVPLPKRHPQTEQHPPCDQPFPPLIAICAPNLGFESHQSIECKLFSKRDTLASKIPPQNIQIL